MVINAPSIRKDKLKGQEYDASDDDKKNNKSCKNRDGKKNQLYKKKGGNGTFNLLPSLKMTLNHQSLTTKSLTWHLYAFYLVKMAKD